MKASRWEFNHGLVLIRAHPFNPWLKIGVSFRLFFKGEGYYPLQAAQHASSIFVKLIAVIFYAGRDLMLCR
jgi:hypothetical protein